jgi:hypothetical protein
MQVVGTWRVTTKWLARWLAGTASSALTALRRPMSSFFLACAPSTTKSVGPKCKKSSAATASVSLSCPQIPALLCVR